MPFVYFNNDGMSDYNYKGLTQNYDLFSPFLTLKRQLGNTYFTL